MSTLGLAVLTAVLAAALLPLPRLRLTLLLLLRLVVQSGAVGGVGLASFFALHPDLAPAACDRPIQQVAAQLPYGRLNDAWLTVAAILALVGLPAVLVLDFAVQLSRSCRLLQTLHKATTRAVTLGRQLQGSEVHDPVRPLRRFLEKEKLVEEVQPADLTEPAPAPQRRLLKDVIA